ncbi:hypothetical protein [Kocuria marina]|uniref:hypothetical protein n=1 Tax=Kocuria marina TaxID=223184 RepID=UPI0019D0A4DE|nr:hypothetical protein [Kocuria indica]MBN6811843.1 hypothetical protein [Kocuria indica]MBN6843537.1 hypothetical protein [Kocuria indica]
MAVLEMTETGQYEDPWDTVPVIGAGMPVERPTGLVGGSTDPALDDLAVVCDITGTPCVVTYRGEEHRVLQPAVRWYERRNWWDVEVRVPRESRTSAVDQERWRVQVVRPGVVVARTFELVRNQFTDQWRVLRVSAA